MPEHLRALVVVLVLAIVVFMFAKAPACAMASIPRDFERRRNLWFAITLSAFLAHNFWVYIIVAAALLLFAQPREPNKLAMFFFLLFAVPAIPAKITGLDIIEHFFTIHYVRLLALTVLLPAFFYLRRQSSNERFGRTLPDKLLAGYLILSFILQLSADTFTNTLRHGVLYAFIDIFLPYYVASRSLKTLQTFRDALMAFAIAAMVLAVIGVFEFAKGWLLYSALPSALGMPWAGVGYLPRGLNLRAFGTTGQPIPMGYVMAVAAGLFLYLKKTVPNQTVWGLGLCVLILGMIASLSRGPWVGAAGIFLIFAVTGPSAGLSMVKFGLVGMPMILALLLTPLGQPIIDHLPFVGAYDEGTVDYRTRLLEISYQVIMQNPVFGSTDFLRTPELQEMRQGEGIIDIVNSYVAVALWSGLVGLSLFSGFFIVIAIGILKAMRSLADKNDERHVLGQALLATLVGIMVIIATVSSISVIPIIYWSVAGLGVAYIRMLALARIPIGTHDVARTSQFPSQGVANR